MAHSTLKLAPGVDKNKTPALNEAAFSDTNLVRFMPDRSGLGLVQKIGGWKKFYGSSFHTPVRALWAWEDTNLKKHLAAGAETATVEITSGFSNGAQAFMNYNGPNIFATGSTIYVSGFFPDGYNGTFTVRRSVPNQVVFDCPETDDITQTGTISTGGALSVITDNTRLFITPGVYTSKVKPRVSTTAGSAVVTIADPNAIVYVKDVVNIKTHISVGGIILFGSYEVTEVRTNEYDIVSYTSLGAQNPATEDVTNGGVLPVFEFSAVTPFVLVKLPNHGLNDGDTFPIVVPIDTGNDRLYGNYIVNTSDVDDPVNTFQITSTGAIGVGSTFCYPASSTSDGKDVSLKMQSSPGFKAGDVITIQGTQPNYDGNYTVISNIFDVVKFADTRDWNKMQALGRIFKETGSVGGSFDVVYADYYTVNYEDTVTLSGFVPFAYNGQYTVSGASSNRATIKTSATGPITTSGTITVNTTNLDAGDAIYEYYRSSVSQPVIQGYGVGGYGLGGYGAGQISPTPQQDPIPIVASDWLLDNWGDYLIATCVGGSIFQWNPLSNAAFASIIPAAPLINDGAFVAMPQRQIVAWGSTFNGIQDPLLIRWCDVSDFSTWVGTVTNQAGSYRLPRGSKIVSCLQGPQQALVWTDIGVWSMQYVGLPIVYSFNEIGTGCGLIGRKAAGALNGVFYWMGQTQFFVLGGEGVMPIPCPIWDAIFQDLDTDNADKIRFAGNSNFNEIAWYYPTVGSGGEVSNYVKYNVALNCWDYGTLERTAWINQSVLGPPIGAGPDGFIYQHEVGYDADGVPMNSYFQTGYFQIGEGEFKIFVDQVWPDFKYGLYDQTQSANLKLTFYVTNYPGDTPREYGPYNMNVHKRYLTPRFRGRLVSIKVESDDAASFWRIGAIRYRATPDGKFG
jgi:hypothetical protein